MPTQYKVAVDAPLREALTYESSFELLPGQSVRVPLGKRFVEGLVVEKILQEFDQDKYTLKSVAEIIEDRPILPETFLKWLHWLSDYYLHPLGQVLSLAFPPLKKQASGKSLSKMSKRLNEFNPEVRVTLNNEQSEACSTILQSEAFKVFLLHGVTGSGKTEVYMNCLAEVLARGKKGLVLVPEIALTPQLLNRFSLRFPGEVAVLHSHLTPREKTNQWWSMIEGNKKILIGARSALFCPLKDLGMIIIDEEHEASFKQDSQLKYHGRDAAIMLGQLSNCPVVLGSATPSLESWWNAQSSRYAYIQLKNRVEDRPMPVFSLIDLRVKPDEDQPLFDRPFWMRDEVEIELRKVLADKKQAAIFLNRRGVAQTVLCESCGYFYECPNCMVGLTVHGKNHLICHYCDYNEQLQETCKNCKSDKVKPIGLGTEQIETDIRRLLPEAKVARADRDEIQTRAQLEELIADMESGEIDILIGTQMIAKGLDFPNLHLVVLALADVGFHMPDFRASERSFQLMTQVAGRSGRHQNEAGQVVVQSYDLGHSAIEFAKNHDFEGFAQQEIEFRRELNYPPFSRLVLLRIEGLQLTKVESFSRLCRSRLNQLVEVFPSLNDIQILGPAPAALAKLRGKYRYQLLIKCKHPPIQAVLLKKFYGDGKWMPSGVKLHIDVDPMNML